ncbi:GNAT family N-acetyltransferase [Cellulosilyticum sp. I15G10I2]|uniref:GNAT family N-acetyltransferase n=1 Tax=Cellulosilyticum sp. I15G10I2 TaxID=1892843 RepID=UPI00085C8F02|nr:GNAT family N-acetyltransferase [Cellulosilyticum sp. I15G10I2]
MLELIPVCNENMHYYSDFKKYYDDYLKDYQSRIHPHNYNEYSDLISKGLLSWKYIVYNKQYVGSIWLEKETHEMSAILGIFICNPIYRNLGVGQKIIPQFINESRKTMDFTKVELHVRSNNTRALNCYRKCGFIETKCYVNNKGIPVIQMYYNNSISC